MRVRALIRHPDSIQSPLVARCGLSASGFGDADVAGHLILGYGVDDQFQRAAIAALVEDRLVDRQILPFDVGVINNQGNVVALLGGIGAAQFDDEGSPPFGACSWRQW